MIERKQYKPTLQMMDAAGFCEPRDLARYLAGEIYKGPIEVGMLIRLSPIHRG